MSDEPLARTRGGAIASGSSRRAFLAGMATLTLAGCVSPSPEPGGRAFVAPLSPPQPPNVLPAAARVRPMMYDALPHERFPVPAVDVDVVDPLFWRQEVESPYAEAPGTLVVDTAAKFLYHVAQGGRATRYGIGVGRQGFAWSGRAIVAYKQQWPRWTPPDTMVARQPELEPYSISNGGMEPGLDNPLGARALYIHQDGRDTLYRLHGTPQPASIGRSVSSGCIRLLNQDVVHLYDTVRDGSPIVVIPDPAMGGSATA